MLASGSRHDSPAGAARVVRAVRALLAPCPAGAGALAGGLAAVAALPAGRHHLLGAVCLAGRDPLPARAPPGLAAAAQRGGRLIPFPKVAQGPVPKPA